MITEVMVYIGRDSVDSYSCALTFGKKYICGRIYSVKGGEIYLQDLNKSYKCVLIDDLGKSLSLSPDNFCSLSEWRDKQLTKMGI